MKFTYPSLLAIASASQIQSENLDKYIQYLAQYGRSYGTQSEFKFRFALFQKRLDQHRLHNQMPGQTSIQGINSMTDRTQEEVNPVRSQVKIQDFKKFTKFDESQNAPIDWRLKGAVTPVKDQTLACDASWAFTTTGAMEGAHFNKVGKLVSLSESQLLNCVGSNHGCKGGAVFLAYNYLKSKPLMTEEAWPYVAQTDSTACYTKYRHNKGVTELKSYENVYGYEPDQMKAALAVGPVASQVAMDSPTWINYTGGVISGKTCGSKVTGHVLIVGWAFDVNLGEYLIVKNSMGTQWGEKGYAKIAIENDSAGPCGINSDPTIPTSKQP